MVFSSLFFLCVFLPAVFVANLLARSVRVKNALLIVASLLFYAYGEPILVLLMLASTCFNWLMGRAVGSAEDAGRRRALVVLAVVVNVGLLGVFKYAGMVVGTINALAGLSIPTPDIPLPLGISFYTFQALSYVIDVYRRDVEAQSSYPRVLLYISFFPQLVAGPIVKYHDIAAEMENRHATADDVAAGLRRFCCGLAKKVLIANVMASAADTLYDSSAASIGCAGAWLAAFAYLLQIYFDFSGYSDMAIGLGRVFGFHFKENFDHPYASSSVTEFWRRWHMSLSTWLKEYLYIPLGGNRKGRGRAIANRIIVFLVCGLWHGANWTFVVWGLLHGLFLLLENVVPIRRLPKPVGIVYTMLVVMCTFVIFRADTLAEAGLMLQAMFSGASGGRLANILVMEQLTPHFLATAVMAVLAASSLPPALRSRLVGKAGVGINCASYACAIVLLFLSMVSLSSGTSNPFIYFRF